MDAFKNHIIDKSETVRDALIKLDKLASDAILFVVDKDGRLIGSLTDGDLRRGFISGRGFNDSILDFIQPNPSYIFETNYSLDTLEKYKKRNLKIIPILNSNHQIIDILNFRIQGTKLQADVLIMAGGEGKRLYPLTKTTPKPLLRVGDKPIIEYNIDRLIYVGIKNIHISINYLGEQLEDYFKDGRSKGVHIEYVREDKPLGTIGSILLCRDFLFDDIIVMNSDLLTNIDFADFFRTYKDSGADMAVATVRYNVDVPYAVLETDVTQMVKSLKEKPRYTYYSNAGIYIINKRLLNMIPKNQHFDITDLMDKVIEMDNKLITYPINGYWLDIGRHEDLVKAQEDIHHLKL
jgi:dTDP-glucose pyrophosphorylase